VGAESLWVAILEEMAVQFIRISQDLRGDNWSMTTQSLYRKYTAVRNRLQRKTNTVPEPCTTLIPEVLACLISSHKSFNLSD
jgi:hypothetical protein